MPAPAPNPGSTTFRTSCGSGRSSLRCHAPRPFHTQAWENRQANEVRRSSYHLPYMHGVPHTTHHERPLSQIDLAAKEDWSRELTMTMVLRLPEQQNGCLPGQLSRPCVPEVFARGIQNSFALLKFSRNVNLSNDVSAAQSRISVEQAMNCYVITSELLTR
eukprot:2761390-Amphidinium_carterae.1